MSEEELKLHRDRCKNLLNGENYKTHHFVPGEIQNFLNLIEQLQHENKELKEENRMLKQDIHITYETSQEMLSDKQKIIDELKETLKGTTHCYDEEEHKRLLEENKDLKERIKRIIKIIDDQLLDRNLLTYDDFRKQILEVGEIDG